VNLAEGEKPGSNILSQDFALRRSASLIYDLRCRAMAPVCAGAFNVLVAMEKGKDAELGRRANRILLRGDVHRRLPCQEATLRLITQHRD
jgi:hypothetical protein